MTRRLPLAGERRPAADATADVESAKQVDLGRTVIGVRGVLGADPSAFATALHAALVGAGRQAVVVADPEPAFGRLASAARAAPGPPGPWLTRLASQLPPEADVVVAVGAVARHVASALSVAVAPPGTLARAGAAAGLLVPAPGTAVAAALGRQLPRRHERT